jgi:enoyl-CoA hydratase/carnithine racemase
MDFITSDELLHVSEDFAQEIIRKSPVAVRLAMEALHYSGDVSFEEALILESNLAGIACSSDDAKEGLRAFVEKRNLQFKGK